MSPPVNHVAPPSVELVESSYDASPKTVSALSRAAHLKETALGECDAVAEAETVGICVGDGVGDMSEPVTHDGHGYTSSQPFLRKQRRSVFHFHTVHAPVHWAQQAAGLAIFDTLNRSYR